MFLGDRHGGQRRHDRRGESPIANGAGIFSIISSVLEPQSPPPTYVDSHLYSSPPPPRGQSSPYGHPCGNLYPPTPPTREQQLPPLESRYSCSYPLTPPGREQQSPPLGSGYSYPYPPTPTGTEQQLGSPPPSIGYFNSRGYDRYVYPQPQPQLQPPQRPVQQYPQPQSQPPQRPVQQYPQPQPQPQPQPPQGPVQQVVPAAGKPTQQATPAAELKIMAPERNSSGADVPNKTIGFHQLYPPNEDDGDDAHIDIIAIHGLAEDAFSAWTEPVSGVLWLRDLLPQYLLGSHLEIKSRVMTFGYQSGMFVQDAYENGARLLTFSEQLLNHLADSDRKSPDGFYRPILFVCHSLGGLIVKAALNLAFNKPSQYPGIVDSTKSIVFLGTPHAGANLSVWARLLGRLSVGLKLNPKSSDDFKTWSGTLMDLATNFVHRAPKLKITTFFETEALGGQIVVDEGSARMNLENERTVPLDGDHLSICRFSDRHQNAARTVLRRIKRTAEDIVTEAVAEKALQRAAEERARREASELPA